MKICGRVDDIPNSDTAEYDQFVMDMQKLARKQVFESAKNKKKIDGEMTVKTEEDCNANAVVNKYKELTTGFDGVKWSLTFSEIVNEMILHHLKKLREFGDSALVLCSFDGAEHGSDKTNIISFSTQIYLYAMGKFLTNTTTRNFYTWMQIMGLEKKVRCS